MDSVTEKAWEVYRSVFTDGEDVVVEDSEGKFYYGILRSFNEYITVTRSSGCWTIHWDDIEFMAHDGFPVNRLMKMSQGEAHRRAEQDSQQIIRAAFEDGLKPTYSFCGGGCPFVAGPMMPGRIFNVGSLDLYDGCEVLEFVAADGAVMHSYDTSHLFLL